MSQMELVFVFAIIPIWPVVQPLFMLPVCCAARGKQGELFLTLRRLSLCERCAPVPGVAVILGLDSGWHGFLQKALPSAAQTQGGARRLLAAAGSAHGAHKLDRFSSCTPRRGFLVPGRPGVCERGEEFAQSCGLPTCRWSQNEIADGEWPSGKRCLAHSSLAATDRAASLHPRRPAPSLARAIAVSARPVPATVAASGTCWIIRIEEIPCISS